MFVVSVNRILILITINKITIIAHCCVGMPQGITVMIGQVIA
jgi:hypothetical protein